MRLRSAGVVELEDARDSKSRVPWGRVGSIPTAGTNKIRHFRKGPPYRGGFLFSHCDKRLLFWAALEASNVFIPIFRLSE